MPKGSHRVLSALQGSTTVRARYIWDIPGPRADLFHIEGLGIGPAVLDFLDVPGFGQDTVDESARALLLAADDAGGDHAHHRLSGVLEGEVQPDFGIGRKLPGRPVFREPEGSCLHFPDILDVRGDIGSPVGDGGFFRLGDPDVAVDAAAGIPAGGFLGIVKGVTVISLTPSGPDRCGRRRRRIRRASLTRSMLTRTLLSDMAPSISRVMSCRRSLALTVRFFR